MEVEVGICPIEQGQSNFDEMVSQLVKICSTEQEISIQIPKTGQYSLYFSNKTSNQATFNAYINKVFQEPLV